MLPTTTAATTTRLIHLVLVLVNAPQMIALPALPPLHQENVHSATGEYFCVGCLEREAEWRIGLDRLISS